MWSQLILCDVSPVVCLPVFCLHNIKKMFRMAFGKTIDYILVKIQLCALYTIIILAKTTNLVSFIKKIPNPEGIFVGLLFAVC